MVITEGHDGLDWLLWEKRREMVDAATYEIKAKTLQTVRGTVQADILKEDGAQNTAFSLLRLHRR